MDADLQDSPDEIPELYQMVKEEGFDIVSGWKKKRYDPITKTIPTKLYNAATRRVSGIKLHDMNCGLKAYKKEVVKSIEVYGEMHRYIPVIAKWAGFNNIGEKVVQHQERKYGKTKFGLERFLFGFLDLFSITFIGRFGKRPMHFFGTIGTLMFVIGFCFSLWIGIDKLFIDKTGTLIASRPSFYIAMTCMVLGVQMFLAGFLGEMLARNSPNRNNYLIKAKTSNLDD
jgi:glycosyltransferase involved in cell wall biosynthesis